MPRDAPRRESDRTGRSGRLERGHEIVIAVDHGQTGLEGATDKPPGIPRGGRGSDGFAFPVLASSRRTTDAVSGARSGIGSTRIEGCAGSRSRARCEAASRWSPCEMAMCREVTAERREEMGSFARSPSETCLLQIRICSDSIVEVDVVSVRLSGDRRRSGLRPSASMPDFAGLVPATRGLIAAPWTLASLSLLPSGKRV